MTTAVEVPSNSQVRKAGRTLRELLRGEVLMDQQAFQDAWEVVERHRAAHYQPMVIANIALRGMCQRLGTEARVTQRLKRMQTILDKLGREEVMNLDRMQDIGGCRVVVPTMEDVYTLFGRIIRRHPNARFKDYVAEPRDSGYRAIHVMVHYGREARKPVEVQLRSQTMHTWANMVEEVSGSLGVNYKKDGDSQFQQWARALSQILELEELGRPVPVDLTQTYTDLMSDLANGPTDGGGAERGE